MSEELTREALYEKAWTTPITTLAIELGISGVAVAKRCRKLNVPTPPRGYWAKLAAGKTPKKMPLPATIGGGEPQVAASMHHTQWPRDVSGLCERAQLLLAELNAAKPDYEEMQSIEKPSFPQVKVTKAMAEPAARLFHAILFAVEATGIPFRKSRSKYEGGYFELKGDRLYLDIREPQKTDPLTPAWGTKKEGTGKLEVRLSSERYARGWQKSWKQNQDGGIREVVESIGASVTEYYNARAKQKAEEAERQRIAHEQWLKEREIQKKKDHEAALVKALKTREEDFFRASEWARLYKAALEYVAECEVRWKSVGMSLSPEQQTWIEWAKATVEAWSPWAAGYPDPARDGSFNQETVVQGGPYPPVRNFPRPPTMPEIKQEAHQTHWNAPRNDPYPFWLRGLSTGRQG